MKKISAIATIITVSALLGAGAIAAKPDMKVGKQNLFAKTDTVPGAVTTPRSGEPLNPLPPQATPNAIPNPNTTPTPVPTVTPNNVTPGVTPTPIPGTNPVRPGVTPTPMPGTSPVRPGVSPTPGTTPITPGVNPSPMPGSTPAGGTPTGVTPMK